eukprot:155760_1
MAVDPTQLQSEMSLDKSGDMTYTSPELAAINNKNIDLSSNSNKSCSSKPKIKSESNDKIIEFMDTPFSESLKRYIDIIGITNNSINRFNPLISETSWINIGIINKDIEDSSYLLLDNNRKLLRTGGLLNDEYISSVSICDLTNNLPNKNRNTNNNINWINLPRLNHRRHGHNTLCINIFNKPHIIAIGGFDSKGNTIAKSEIISLKHIQSHIQSSLKNKNNKSQQLINGGNRNRNMNIGYWNIGECMELSSGIADFGICSDKINNRIYICGGINSQFKSLSKCLMYDIKTNKLLNLPNLNYERHCNKCELLYTNNPNILITFGGWTGIARNTIEIIDLRNNINKWQININNNNNNKKNKNKNGYGIFNYPHACCTSIIKNIKHKNKNKRNKNIQQQLNGLHINDKYEIKNNNNYNNNNNNENVIIVCGHKEGLFIETNVIEAFEIKTKTWHTIARFKYAQNCNINQNLINAQQKSVPLDNTNIDDNSE